MKVVELFAGVGGFRLGFERAGHEVIFANEWDKYAADIYDRNFGNKGHQIDRTDITKLNAEAIPPHDILVGGFPCQAFSVAGRRRGFEEARGTLFFDIARILAHHKPKHILLENVKGLVSHDGGRTIQAIVRVLTGLGYRIEWCVLNSKDFGVPQNRERIFIVGHFGNQCAGQIFPIGQDHSQAIVQTVTPAGISAAERVYTTDGLSPTLAANGGGMDAKTGLYISRVDRSKGVYDLREPETAGALTGTMHKGIDAAGHTGVIEQGFDTIDGKAHTLDANYYKALMANQARTGVVETKPMRWARTEEGKKIRRESQAAGKDYTPFNGAARKLVPSDDGVVGTLTSQAISKDSLLGQGARIRRLTPVECERLQGFPDGWTAEGLRLSEWLEPIEYKVSDTQRYKTMGNAVTVNVVQAIAERMNETCLTA